jgi:Cu-Zn family superoxide dismutase
MMSFRPLAWAEGLSLDAPSSIVSFGLTKARSEFGRGFGEVSMRTSSLLLAAVVALPVLSSSAMAQMVDTVETTMINTSGAAIGKASLRGAGAGVVIRISLQPGALSPGWHGMHFHAVGDCSDTEKFLNSKAHINHDNKKHGLLNAEGPDNGDLPNVFAAADGSVNAELFSPFVRLSGPTGLRDADGSALLIHAAEDDHAAQPIGNAGARVACGVIR